MSKSWTSRLVWEARCWKIWLGRRWYWLWDSSSVSPNNCAFERDDLSSHRCAQLGYEFKMSDDSYRTSITITCGADRSWNRDTLPPCECKMTDNSQFAIIQFGIYLSINVAKNDTCSDFINKLKFVTHSLNCFTHFPSFWLTCSIFWPTCIPDLCQFWGNTALIRPVKGAQYSQKFSVFDTERASLTNVSHAHLLWICLTHLLSFLTHTCAVVHCLTAPDPPAESKLTLRDYDPSRYYHYFLFAGVW